MLILAILATALLFGGMVLYSFGFAAFLFTALPPDIAGPTIRRAFPLFYLFVLGVDFCRPMLLEGLGKSAADRVSLVEGDALQLPVATASVDAATVAFGIRNVVDPEAGVAEMARCVRPGGRGHPSADQ